MPAAHREPGRAEPIAVLTGARPWPPRPGHLARRPLRAVLGDAWKPCRPRAYMLCSDSEGDGMAGDTEDRIFIGRSVPAKGDKAADQYLTLKFGNRHGLITGATGTGKTVTLQVLAEGFSRAGVPVFCRRHQGRPLRHRRDGRAEGLPASSAPSEIGFDDYAGRRVPGDLLGPVRRAGPPDPHHRLGDGAAAAGAPARAQRHPGRRAQHRLQASPTTRACCCSTSRTCGRC